MLGRCWGGAGEVLVTCRGYGRASPVEREAKGRVPNPNPNSSPNPNRYILRTPKLSARYGLCVKGRGQGRVWGSATVTTRGKGPHP